ncbi:hypothetical protein ACJMK2_017893 [Sinanodonta woodiana]|uniref:Carboxylesterase type B domain-containing protein n=1 Tax=Sinanodonta woodiana TaxID=1069815 RepID=A0ABD3UEF7_SINWO
MGTRTIKTKDGILRGALVEFSDANLKAIETFRGIEYGMTHGDRMRFMPPSSSQGKRKYTYLAFSFRPVCHQKIINENDLSRFLPKNSVQQLKRIAPYTISQHEDCLTLNLHAPIPGKSAVMPLYGFWNDKRNITVCTCIIVLHPKYITLSSLNSHKI